MGNDLGPYCAIVAVISMTAAMVAYSQPAFEQSAHDPSGYSATTYLWVFWLSIWGATIAYLQRIKARPHSFSIITLLIEWVTAPAAGVLAFWACEAAQVDRLLMASSVLMAGYGGKRAVSFVGARIANKRDGCNLEE